MSTEPSNCKEDAHTDTQTDRRVMKYAIEMGSVARIQILNPTFIFFK
jgi:hypothetical protein